jgi:hypothetical protein
LTGDDPTSVSGSSADEHQLESIEAGPLTAKEASQLIRSALVSSVYALLKQTEFAPARERIFAGFRASVDNLKSPLARGRLLTELIADSKLAGALRDRRAQQVTGQRHTTEQYAERHEPAHDPRQRQVEPEAARARHKRELKEARDQIQDLSGRMKSIERELLTEQAAAASLRSELASEQNQNSWRERKMRRLERELSEARGGLQERKHGDQPTSRRQAQATSRDSETNSSGDRSQSDMIAEVFDRLIARGKLEAVELVAEEIVRIKPSDPVARRARARLRIAQGDKTAALDDLRFLFDAELSSGELAEAATTLLMALSATGDPDQKMALALYAALSKRPALAVVVADVLRPLRGTPSYRTLEAWCRPPLRNALFAPMGNSAGEDLPVELRRSAGNENLTVQQLVRAIDGGDITIVSAARRVVADLDKQSRDDLEAAIARIADASYLRLLVRRDLAGPAIIDASNVANYERILMATDRPALAHIFAVRLALREQGFFPVLVIGDANLPFTVDREDQVRAMIERQELEVVTSGTDADEVIVREARRLNAAVVTNDYMADWDPAGEIEKIQYSISLTDGRATLYR